MTVAVSYAIMIGIVLYILLERKSAKQRAEEAMVADKVKVLNE